VDGDELSRNRRIDVPIVADTGLAVRALVDALRSRGASSTRDSHWLRDALAPRLRYLSELSQAVRAADAANKPVHPLAMGDAVAAAAPRDAIFVGDGADVQNWMYGAIRVARAPGFLDHYPMGAMGVGTPLAVGAAAAAREIAERDGSTPRRVVLTTGDGSFGFYPAELHAAAMAGLPLVVVIGNDAAWGTELHGQHASIGRAVNTELGLQRYERFGEAFGCEGIFVATLAELAPALERAFASRGPVVVNIALDRDAGRAQHAEPLAQMILFDDLATNLHTQHQFVG
jgi:acetolactate synthase-1/2/3 large subunit